MKSEYGPTAQLYVFFIHSFVEVTKLTLSIDLYPSLNYFRTSRFMWQSQDDLKGQGHMEGQSSQRIASRLDVTPDPWLK